MVAYTFLFKRCFEFVPREKIDTIPALVRGIYVLFKEEPSSGRRAHMNVVYVGMARGEKSGAKGRLKKHRSQKADLWTHCSVFEVWDNIPAKQVEELEGLFRHLYRRDAVANCLNKQKAYAPLSKLTKATKSAARNTP